MRRMLQDAATAIGAPLHGADRAFLAVSTDSRTLQPGALFVALRGPNFDGAGFVAAAAQAGAAGAIVPRVMPVELPQIPVAALLQRGGATAVALTGADGIVHLRPVKVASTDGVMINVAEGVRPGEKVALNVPNEVTEGTHIRPVGK